MQQVKQSTLWFTINKPVVSSLEELATVMGVSLEEATAKAMALINQQYSVHNWLVKFRSKSLEATGEALGLPRESEEKDGKTKFTETESDYYARQDVYVDENNIDMAEQYGEAMQTLADSIPYDFKATTRGVGAGSKPAKQWLAVVDEILVKDKLAAACAKFGIKIEEIVDEQGTLTEDGRNSLGNAIKSAVNEQKKAAAANALAL